MIPTTKYTQIDTMKRKKHEAFEPQARHQIVPPTTNFASIASPPPYSHLGKWHYTWVRVIFFC